MYFGIPRLGVASGDVENDGRSGGDVKCAHGPQCTAAIRKLATQESYQHRCHYYEGKPVTSKRGGLHHR